VDVERPNLREAQERSPHSRLDQEIRRPDEDFDEDRALELCAEVALQPLERFALDAAIVFSDILTIPDAMGLELSFGEGEGPRFQRPLRDEVEVVRFE